MTEYCFIFTYLLQSSSKYVYEPDEYNIITQPSILFVTSFLHVLFIEFFHHCNYMKSPFSTDRSFFEEKVNSASFTRAPSLNGR